MKLSEIINEYGDFEISPRALEDMGIIKKNYDIMIRAKDVSILTNNKNAYEIITRLKIHYGLQYSESSIPLRIFCEYFGLDIAGCYEVLKMPTMSNSRQTQN